MAETQVVENTPKEETQQETQAGTGAETGAPREDTRMHQGRVIVRNLAFDLREKHVKNAFAGIGKHCIIESITIPLNSKNNQNRGFAFVEFATRQQAQEGIDLVHGKKFKGRSLTVEFSLSKQSYEKKIQNLLDNTNMDMQAILKAKLVKDKTEATEGEVEGEVDGEKVAEGDADKKVEGKSDKKEKVKEAEPKKSMTKEEWIEQKKTMTKDDWIEARGEGAKEDQNGKKKPTLDH